jgi:hypothetical protein
MLLSTLLLAAALQGASAPPPRMILPRRGPVTVYASRDEAFQAMRAREACRTAGLELADQPTTAAKPEVKRLGDLPPANHTLTVLRSIDGCPVSSTVRYNVDRPAGR